MLKVKKCKTVVKDIGRGEMRKAEWIRKKSNSSRSKSEWEK
jgi:hypothetical protein